jgi:hypothetical protein
VGLGKNIRFKHYLILLLPVGILLANITAFFPELIENVYSTGLYPNVVQIFSIFTGIFPFSVGELIVIIFALLIIHSLIYNLRKGKIRQFFINTLVAVSVIYFGFVIIWGLNYNRLPFAEIANYNLQPVTREELILVCEDLIDRANTLREKVDEDSNGTMQINGGQSDIFSRASLGYEKAAEKFPELGGRYGRPKGVMISKVMAYAGISGIYFPFTGEANVNTLTPDYCLPSTVTHEMAHQRGFAREDEANYIAYLTCVLHPDFDFQYSGTFLAMRNAMYALSQYDYKTYLELRKKYSEGIKSDLADLAAFWEKYEGPMERISSEINDIYLKSNRQIDGIYSYNRMVDLLVAEYR